MKVLSLELGVINCGDSHSKLLELGFDGKKIWAIDSLVFGTVKIVIVWCFVNSWFCLFCFGLVWFSLALGLSVFLVWLKHP